MAELSLHFLFCIRHRWFPVPKPWSHRPCTKATEASREERELSPLKAGACGESKIRAVLRFGPPHTEHRGTDAPPTQGPHRQPLRLSTRPARGRRRICLQAAASRLAHASVCRVLSTDGSALAQRGVGRAINVRREENPEATPTAWHAEAIYDFVQHCNSATHQSRGLQLENFYGGQSLLLLRL